MIRRQFVSIPNCNLTDKTGISAASLPGVVLSAESVHIQASTILAKELHFFLGFFRGEID